MNRWIYIPTLILTLAAAGTAEAKQKLLIVSIGDSYASGEGNPNAMINGVSQWDDIPCHRSRNNGRRIAASRIHNLPEASVEFLDFSCSGASINNGLLGPMPSQAPETPNTEIAAQIDQVVEWQQKRGGVAIDILMISIGGNDAWFPRVVKECLKSTDCRWSETVTDAIQRITGVLPDRYDNLAAQIRDRIKVQQVYITHYPNGLQLRPGTLCGDFDDLFTPVGDWAGLAMKFVTNEEVRFLIENYLRPLNDQIDAAAARNGWRAVTGVEDTFVPHGYCNPFGKRWLHTLGDSFLHQSTHTGTAHPTVAGHRAYADSLIRQATLDFNLSIETPRLISTTEANVGNTAQVALGGVGKRIRAEIGQTAAYLSVDLQFRVRDLMENGTPAFVSLAMTDNGPGELNWYEIVIPGSQNLMVTQRLEYRVKVNYTWNGITQSFTTSTQQIVIGSALKL